MKKGLPQEALKGIACASMLLDHIGYAFYPGSALRVIGRIAFPLFCFLLAEGAVHTRNPKRYALRLGIGALLSELPFDYLISGKATWAHQNIMFTLLLSFAALQILRREGSAARLLAVAGLAAVAQLINADYGAAGVMMVCLFGITREMPRRLLWQFAGMAMIFAALGGGNLMCGLLSIVPIALYSGRKLTQSKAAQWAYYLFYPAHLVLLSFIVAKI